MAVETHAIHVEEYGLALDAGMMGRLHRSAICVGHVEAATMYIFQRRPVLEGGFYPTLGRSR